jgi:predicted transcriptional regulator
MDWKTVIAELAGLGVTQPQIAEACRCSQSAISQLATGRIKDPRDSIGQAIRAMLEAKRADAAQKAVAPPAPNDAAPKAAPTNAHA